jgi:hypothetical protein
VRSSKKVTPQKTSMTCPTDISEVSNKNSRDESQQPNHKKTSGTLNKTEAASLVLMSAAKLIHLQKILKSTVYSNFGSKVYIEFQW